ncbi:unnamed protein product [Arabidopsis halleri]
MGKSKRTKMEKSKKKDLNQSLITHPSNIVDTLQLYPKASPTVEKFHWDYVLQISDYLSTQATIVRMLWTGESPKAESLTETMKSYFNALHGFLLCFHGSTLGAGPTLSSIIHGSVKQIVDSSFRLNRVLSPFTRDHMKKAKSRLFHSFQEQFWRHALVSRRFLQQTSSRLAVLFRRFRFP